MAESTRGKGKQAEQYAVAYLIDNGYEIIMQNYQIRGGEIDCIAQAPCGDLVFVEVKSGASSSYGDPLFRINRAKKQQLQKTARYYLYHHQMRQVPFRFDIIVVTARKEIQHIKNAIIQM